MKKLLALFLLVVALSVAAPGFLATQTQDRYNAAVTQLQAAGYRVVEQTYARGWFTSDARLQLEIPVPEGRPAGTEPPRVLVKTHAVHGPFLGDLERPFGLARLDSEIWLGSEPLVVGRDAAPVRTLVGFLGAVRTVVQVPARQLTFEGGTLETAAVAGAFDFGSGERVAVGELSMPSMRLQASDGAAGELRGLRLDVDLRRSPAGLPVGRWRLGMEWMSVTPPAQTEAKPFAMHSFAVTGTSEERDGAMDVTADYQLGSLVAEGLTYGPFDLRLAARRLAVDALVRIQAAGEEAIAAGATVEGRSEALGVALLANADALLAKDPSVALDQLSFDMPEGRVAASFELRTVGLRAAELRNAQAALQRLQGKAALRLPEVVLAALLRQQGRQQLAALAEEHGDAEQPSADEVEEAAGQYAAQQIETLVAQQILVRDAGALAFAAELRNGLLTVNGKSIPLASLLQRPAAPAH
jgi:uncharacterized protein YdgA (DUF945 family)